MVVNPPNISQIEAERLATWQRVFGERPVRKYSQKTVRGPHWLPARKRIRHAGSVDMPRTCCNFLLLICTNCFWRTVQVVGGPMTNGFDGYLGMYDNAVYAPQIEHDKRPPSLPSTAIAHICWRLRSHLML